MESHKIMIHQIQKEIKESLTNDQITKLMQLIENMTKLHDWLDEEFQSNKTSNTLMRMHNLTMWMRAYYNIVSENHYNYSKNLKH